jgi:hypothetical protein
VPVLSEFDFTPKTVDVSTGPKTMTVTARVADATGGQAPTMILDSDTTTQTLGLGTMSLVSGTPQDGLYQRTITIPATAAPGAWTVTIYPLSDTAGNSETSSHNHPTKLAVTNGAVNASAPDAPTAVSAVRGNGSATVSWSPPADNGSPITGYTVTAFPGGSSVTVGGTSTTATVSGLTNGTAYTFAVTASNAIGMSPPSAPSASVTPATKPGRIAKPSVTVTGRKAVIRWLAPTNGGSAISGYSVFVNGNARTTSAGVRKFVLKNLTPGRYQVQVKATNALGAGPSSDTVSFRIR